MVLAVLAGAPAQAAESPATDPFYARPANLAGLKPGAIVRARTVEVTLGTEKRMADQLAFRSADVHGRPVVAVTTVITPTGEQPPGGRNVVSIQDATNAADVNCHPSYQLQIGSPDNRNMQVEGTAALALLAQGSTVVVPDHLGPDPMYIVKDMEGKVVLDGLRAALRHGPAQLGGADTQIALIGYSGGAHGSAAANELHAAYAPELNIVAVTAGGVPVANRATFDYLDGSVGTGALLGVSIGIDRAFSAFRLLDLLNVRGRELIEKFKKGCSSSVFGAPFEEFDDFTVVPNAIDLPRVARIIRRNQLGQTTPIAPSYYYNGISDELIWIKPLDALVGQYCAEGATISYFRDPAGLEHVQALANFVPLATAYIADRFAGVPAPTTCAEDPPPPPCKRTLRLRVPPGTHRAAVSVNNSVIKVVERSGLRRIGLPLAGRSSRVVLRVRGRDVGGRPFRRVRARNVKLCR